MRKPCLEKSNLKSEPLDYVQYENPLFLIVSVNDRDERETAYSVHFKDVFAAINIIVPSDHEKHVYVSRQTAHTQKKAAAPSAQANFVCAETNTLLLLHRRGSERCHKRRHSDVSQFNPLTGMWGFSQLDPD